MRTLVTGGAGFIGSAIARALVQRGDSVRILDNLITGSEDNVPDGAELIKGDLQNERGVEEACRDIDVVSIKGAVRSVPRSVDEPLLTLECNVIGTLRILLAAVDGGVRRVVYASSSSVYGDTEGRTNVETMRTNPASPYAASKLAAENYCRMWMPLKGLSTVSLRYFNVLGPGQHAESKYSAVFRHFISAPRRGPPTEAPLGRRAVSRLHLHR
jgi:UDP-glucose 4-epimerase